MLAVSDKQNKVKFKGTDVFRSRSLSQVPLPIKKLTGRKNLEPKVAEKKYQTQQTKSEVEERLLAEVRKHTHTVGTQKNVKKRTPPKSRGDRQGPENLMFSLRLPFKISEGSSSPSE